MDFAVIKIALGSEVSKFTESLNAELDKCDNGEGIFCATLDASLKHYAERCCGFSEGLRQWARDVFAGRVLFDQEAARVWNVEGWKMLNRMKEMQQHARSYSEECFDLNNLNLLESALWNLEQQLYGWIAPKLSVGPSARQGLPAELGLDEEVRRRIESLQQLPADWKPDDQRQRALLRKVRGG